VRTITLLICLLTATACDEKSAVGPSIPLNEQFTLRANESVVIEDAGLGVQFLRVTGDSRCPADAVCIQGGDAIVHVRAIDRAGSVDYQLHMGDSSRASAMHGSARITLVRLEPFPFSSRTIAADEYRATLTVTHP
jgi:hypothetical protein